MSDKLQAEREALQKLVDAYDQCIYLNDYCGLECSKSHTGEVREAFENARSLLKSTPASPLQPSSVEMTDETIKSIANANGHPVEGFYVAFLERDLIWFARRLLLQSSPKGASTGTEAEELITVEASLRFQLECAEEKLRQEEQENRELRDRLASQPSAASGRELPEALEFANHVINGVFEGGDWDGGDLQNLAVDYGLLKPTEMQESCGENCQCAENGADFPAICYRKTYALAVLTGAAPADKDAERYRHLRAGNDYTKDDAPMVLLYEAASDNGERPFWSISGEVLDSKVDAAIDRMRSESGNGGKL